MQKSNNKITKKIPDNYYKVQIGRNSKKKQIKIQTTNKKYRKINRSFLWKANWKISKGNQIKHTEIKKTKKEQITVYVILTHSNN